MGVDDAADTPFTGRDIERREDPTLLTGRATYTDDINRPRQVHAAIVRSRHAHARIESVDTSAAEAIDGVVAVYTGADIEASGVPNDIQTGWLLPGLERPRQRIAAVDRVRYQGEPIAVVVAEDRYTARDGVEAVSVEYDRLDPVLTPADALAEDAPAVHDGTSNVAFDWEIGDADAVEEAFESAAHTASLDLEQQRVIPAAMEPRAAVADYDDLTGELTLWMTTQNPHLHKSLLAEQTLGLPEQKIRVVAPEVGGGFGNKIYHYPDEALASWCSMQLHRPVKWQARRSEDNAAACHSRAHTTHGEIAADADGRILAIRAETRAIMGAYLHFFAPAIPTLLYAPLFPAQYGVPEVYCHVVGTFTNSAPVEAYRGAGRPEAMFLVERLVDTIAREVGLDPAEIRRRNYIPPEEFPFDNGLGLVYDSGDYEPALDEALDAVDYETLRARQRELREEGRYLGIGVGSYVEACGMAPSRVATDLGSTIGFWESATLRFDPSGTVTVYCGTSGHGQGHETTFAQVAADELGVPYEDVEIVEGDTERTPEGRGSYGSRSAPVGANAVVKSARMVVEKGRRIAAHRLEASESDIEFEAGTYRVTGAPELSITIQEIAREAHVAADLPEGTDPGFEATGFFDPEDYTYPFGTHVAVVEVDPETGEIDLQRYVAVDDVGNQINPKVVEGQIHGGIVQGIGQALFEEAVYADNGTLLSSTFQDYALPKAASIPPIETRATVTPCPHNALGVKGVGEAGTIASPPAVVNAVVDALSPFGVTHIDMPLTEESVWQAVRDADE